MNQSEYRGIAVIGMAGRFPGAADVQELWKNLCDMKDVSVLRTDEDLKGRVPDEFLRNHDYVRRVYLLEKAEEFDPGFFGYTPSEAAGIDPQQRLLLETAWKALEDSGHVPSEVTSSGSTVGVFASISHSSLASPDFSSWGANPAGYMACLLGNDKDYASTRISYKLDLHGPSMTLLSACSSSLVGIAMACQNLEDYTCDYALAGGATVMFPQGLGYMSFDEGGVSKDGLCHAFDHRASGTNSGCGVGMVLLKRLEDAVRDGDHIYCVVKGYAVNNDGSDKVGFTAPSIHGQEACLREALEVAGVDPASVSFIETHGTGTPMGDPMEAKALDAAYGREGAPLVLGSIKSNIGHLNAAAGVASFIKTALSIEQAVLPGIMNYEAPNPALKLESTRMQVGNKTVSWNAPVRRAGISSFGLGGTNCHMILEEAPRKEVEVRAENSKILPHKWLVPLSAASSRSLDMQAERLEAWITEHPSVKIDDVAFTLQQGREHFGLRRAVHASTADELRDFLARRVWQEGGRPGTKAAEPKVCFMFSGTGSQYEDMGKDLYETEPAFRRAVDSCAEILKRYLDGRDIREQIRSFEGRQSGLDSPEIGFPALFVIEYALSELWKSYGIMPACVGGHSFGQYTAATVAGVFSLEDALRISVKRGRLMSRTAEGRMMLVFASEDKIRPLLFGSLSLAVINSDRLCTVAGVTEEMEALRTLFVKKNIHCRSVAATRAGHSCLMDPVLDEFHEFMKTIFMNPPSIPILSNTTGTWMTDDEAVDPEAWVRHMRQTVRFSQNLETLFSDEKALLLEVGPGRVLATLSCRAPQSEGRTIVASMKDAGGKELDRDVFFKALGALYCAGCTPVWNGKSGSRISLPGYAFDATEFPVDNCMKGRKERKGQSLVNAFVQGHGSLDKWFYLPLWKRIRRISASGQPDVFPSTWLLFEDECGIADTLCSLLAGRGCRVVRVSAGSAFSLSESAGYRLRPGRQEDYVSLFRDLEARKMLPDRIIHSMTLCHDTEVDRSARTYDVQNQLGFRSLLCIARAISDVKIDRKMGLAVLTSQCQSVMGTEKLIPEKTLLLGPCRIIPSEYSGIQSMSIDLEMCGESADFSAVCGDIVREVACMPIGDEQRAGWNPSLAYRGGYCWAWTQDRTAVNAVPDGGSFIRRGGTYLITGGFGGVAGELASYLASTYGANMVLVGRSYIPPREDWDAWIAEHEENDPASGRIRRIRALEGMGIEVLAMRANVSVDTDMDKVFAAAKERFGRIDGIFHAASDPSSSMIQMQNENKSASVLGTKIGGAMSIEKFARAEHPDFVFVFSSTSSSVPLIGHADYTAACIYLDAWTRCMNDEGICRTVSVNWGFWQGVGIGTTLMPKLKELLGENVEMRGIRPSEGMECIERVLVSPFDQVVVSPSDYGLLVEASIYNAKQSLMEYGKARKSEKTADRPNLAVSFREPAGPVEKVVALIWGEILGFRGVGGDDGFIELGGDSLNAMPMVSKLEEIFRIKVPLGILSAEGTVAKLASWLVRNEKSEGQVERIAQMYLKIRSMSPEEVRKLMEGRQKVSQSN